VDVVITDGDVLDPDKPAGNNRSLSAEGVDIGFRLGCCG
jgi:hypothetical protein